MVSKRVFVLGVENTTTTGDSTGTKCSHLDRVHRSGQSHYSQLQMIKARVGKTQDLVGDGQKTYLDGTLRNFLSDSSSLDSQLHEELQESRNQQVHLWE